MRPLLKFFIGLFMLYGLMLILGCGNSHGVNVHYGVQWSSGYYRSNHHHHHRPPAVRPPRPPKPPGGGTRPPGGGRPTQLPAKRR
jgi:hypothetical protein